MISRNAKRLYNALSATGLKIYPIIAEEGATPPYLTYRRTSSYVDNKDGEVVATYEVNCVTCNYADGVAQFDATLAAVEGLGDYLAAVSDNGETWQDGVVVNTMVVDLITNEESTN